MDANDNEDYYADTFDGSAPWIDDDSDGPDKGKSAGKGRKQPVAQQVPPKVLVACVYCRHRRIRCDGLTPCTSCAQRGRECLYPTEPPKKRGPKGKSPKYDGGTPVGSPIATNTPKAGTPTPHGSARPKQQQQQTSKPLAFKTSARDAEEGLQQGDEAKLRAAGAAPSHGSKTAATDALRSADASRHATYVVDSRVPVYGPPVGGGGGPRPLHMHGFDPSGLRGPLLTHHNAPLAHHTTAHDGAIFAIPVTMTGPGDAGGVPMLPMPHGRYLPPSDAGVFPLPSERDLRAIESFFVNLNGSIRCVDEESFNHNVTQWLRGCSAAALHPAMPRLWWCAHSGIEPQHITVKPPDLDRVMAAAMGSGVDNYSKLTNIDKAQVAQYFAVLAIGYRLLRGRDGKPAAETPILADAYYEKARALAFSTMDDPSYPLISALLCMAHYSVGIGRMVAATLVSSMAWRLARACGLSIDDGALGSACRFFRQVVCTDLDPLPLTARRLPNITRPDKLQCADEDGGSARPQSSSSVSQPAADEPSVRPPPIFVRNDSRSSSGSEPGAHTDGSPAPDGSAHTAKWTWMEGPPAVSGTLTPAEPSASAGWTAPLAATLGEASLGGDPDAPGLSKQRILSWSGQLLDSGAKPTMSLGNALLGDRARRGLVAKEHLDTCWGKVRITTGASETVVLDCISDGKHETITITAHYLDMRIQELMGYALSRMTNIRRGMLTPAHKREVWALVDELVDISCIDGVELGPGRLATIYGLKAITSRQAGHQPEAELFASKAVELWGSLKLSQTSHSFLMSFVARHVALIMLSLELSQAVTDIASSRKTGGSSSGSQSGKGSVSEHESERSSLASFDGKHERLSRGKSSDWHLPALSEYRGFFTLATMIGSVANHWPICARMYHGMMSEAAAMHAASAQRLASSLASSNAAPRPRDHHVANTIASMSEYLADPQRLPKMLKTISGQLPDVPESLSSSHDGGGSGEYGSSAEAGPSSSDAHVQHLMAVHLLATDHGAARHSGEHEHGDSGHAAGSAQPSTHAHADGADGGMFSPLDLLCQVLNQEQPLPVPSPADAANNAESLRKPKRKASASSSSSAPEQDDAGENSDLSVESHDGSGSESSSTPLPAWMKSRSHTDDRVMFSHQASSNGAHASETSSARDILPPPPPAIRENSAVSVMSAASNVPQSANELQQARRTANFATLAFTAGSNIGDVFRNHSVADRSYSFGGAGDEGPADASFGTPGMEMSFSRAGDGRTPLAMAEPLPPGALSAFLGGNPATPSNVSAQFVGSAPVGGVKRPHPSIAAPLPVDPSVYNLYGPTARLASVGSITPSPFPKRPRIAQIQHSGGDPGPHDAHRGSIGSVADLAPPSPHRLPDGMVSVTPTGMQAGLQAGVSGLRPMLPTPQMGEMARLQSDVSLPPNPLGDYSHLRR